MTLKEKIFVILRSALNKSKLDEKFIKDFSYQEFVGVCKVLHAHDLAHLLYDVITENKISFSDEGFTKTLKKLSEIKNLCLYRYVSMENEFVNICSLFDREKIEYLPLKGAVIREYYPEGWMRTSCDIDVLIHDSDLKKVKSSLEKELLYKTEAKNGYHDWSFYSPSNVHLELHFTIKENKPFIDKLLETVWENVLKDENTTKLRMTNEFFAFHIIAHMSYHFLGGGCGIKPLMDLWVLRNKNLYNEEKIKEMCRECGILKFYNTVCAISEKWFSGENSEKDYSKIEEYIVSGGVYGTKENSVTINISHDKNIFSYYLKRIFLPYSAMKVKYPVLKKLPFLLPIFWVVRWFGGIFSGRAKTELNITKNRDEEKSQSIESVFKQVGLNDLCK